MQKEIMIKIVKCNNPKCWYVSRVGEIFVVTDVVGSNYYSLSLGKFISKEDVVILGNEETLSNENNSIDKHITFSYYNGRETIDLDFTIEEGATWCAILGKFNAFLHSLGYSVPDALLDLESMF